MSLIYQFGTDFSAPAARGTRVASAIRPFRAAVFFLHRLRGAHELPQAGSPYPGGVFSAEPQRGIRRRCGGNVAAPAAGVKRKDNLRFSFLFELLPFPCLDSLAKIGERRPLRNRRTTVGLPLRLFREMFAVHR